MTFPQLGQFTDLGWLLLRVMVAVVFFDSGRRSFFQADERSKNLGMSKGFTRFLGLAEMAGALGVAFGILTQLAAPGLILVMAGPSTRKYTSGTLASGVKTGWDGIMTCCSW